MQFRKDGRYTETFTCRCAALVAKPLIMDKPVYCLNFFIFETASKQFRRESTNTVRDIKTTPGRC